ncbi:Ca2+-dependent phosphoinositide-specific phospholipase C, partial [Echinimonas agarilytica]
MLNRIGATLCIIVSSVNCAHGNIKSSSEHAVQQQSVRFNHAQFLGSHNSYKKAVHPTVLTLITSHNPKLSRQINYSHIDLDAQLDVGLRHLEIDVLVDDTGGKYAYPLAEKIAGSRLLDKAERQQLLKPGFKVLHIPDLDISSHCQLFSECLHQLTAWSNRNPEHLPISILLNVKESHIKFVKGTIPEEFGPAQYQALDRVIFNAISEQS